VDLEPFKGHTYPDVLISVLIEFFRSVKLWLDEAAVARANRKKVGNAGSSDRGKGRSPDRPPKR
jgi:hypothetical protein